MFGLCMPTGTTYLVLTNGKAKDIMMNDESNPRKFIMTDKYVFQAVKSTGYKNVEAIVYQRNYRDSSRKVVVPMADYYAERGQDLEG